MKKYISSALMIGTSVLYCSLPSMAMEEDKSETSKVTCLNDLPSELHVEIASKSPPQTLATLALVNRYWKDISETDSIWKSIAQKKSIFLSEAELNSDNIKSKVKEYATSIVTTIINKTCYILFIKPVVGIYCGSSISEIKDWRANRESPSENVFLVSTSNLLPEYKLDISEKLEIRMHTIRQLVTLPEAKAYIGDILQISIHEEGFPRLVEIDNHNNMFLAPKKYNNERNKYEITANFNYRFPYTLVVTSNTNPGKFEK